MPLLRVIPDAPGFCKATFQGPQGSGKTFTAAKLAIRIHTLFGSKKPIAFYDTESGSDYIAAILKEGTGLDPLRVKTRAFGDLMEFGKECVAGAADIGIVDSITHVWREIQSAHMAAKNEERARKGWEPLVRMDIQDIMRIKDRWQPWPDFFLNSPLHLIVCGREGGEWGHQTDEETGKRELIQVGKKMKVEGEFGYEASLMVSMSIRQNAGGWVKKRGQKSGELGTARPQEMIQVATILKDRFDELNGQTVEMPDGEWFDPFLKRLNPASHQGVNTERRTPMEAEASGYDRARADRDILCEKIEAELVRAMPGQSAPEKKLKGDVLESCFKSRSWTEITTRCPLQVLREGFAVLARWMVAVDKQRRDGIDLTVAVEESKAQAFIDAKDAQEAERALGGAPAKTEQPPGGGSKVGPTEGNGAAAGVSPAPARTPDDNGAPRDVNAGQSGSPAPSASQAAKPRTRRTTADIEASADRALSSQPAKAG